MRLNQGIFDAVESGELIGDNAVHGRVTIEPDWQLGSTPPSWGSSIRGPFRWFQRANNSQTEIDVPNIKSISIDRTLSQDIATCTIQMYNQVHDINGATPELITQLGKPGFFWPKHGQSTASQVLWNQTLSTGKAFDKNGTAVNSFSWTNALVPYALLRTYQGYGGNDLSVQAAITAGNIQMTGVWMIDQVTAGTDGVLNISCRDVGRLLLDQIAFPPLIPSALYPLEYYPPGKSAFDSFWEPKARSGVNSSSQGRVKLWGDSQSSGSTSAQLAVDGNWGSYCLSDAYQDTDSATGTPWFQFKMNYDSLLNQGIDKLRLKPWAGGYVCYVSVYESGAWQGSGSTPGSSIPFVKEINIPLGIPDNNEKIVYIDLPRLYSAQYVRLTFRHLYYSGQANGSGYQYRAGIRDLLAYRSNNSIPGNYVNPNPTPDDNWAFSMTAHPTRGYWVCDSAGSVYGFGDAADYDSDAFGSVSLGSYVNPLTVGMASHPSGQGYWVLERNGAVHGFGASAYHGQHIVSPGTDLFGADAVQAMDIAPTYTGNGYWVVYSNGVVYGFGDATPSYTSHPMSAVDTFMQALITWTGYPPGSQATTYPYTQSRMGTAIAAHPHKMGYWITTGSGEVYAYGDVQHFGQMINRTYNEGMSQSFRLSKDEFPHGMCATTTGNGYWIAFGSARIAAFGDAVGQGPVDIYAGMRPEVTIVPPTITDWNFFRALVWDISPDPDGKGFWVLAASGDVGSYNAEFWGAPGFYGLSGFRWHDGNYKDYSDIVKDILRWSGFTLYNASQTGEPPVYGNIESTGIMADNALPGDKFDKRTGVDIIKEFKEIVGYNFYIDEEGGARFESPNWWRAGNFDNLGAPIYVTYDNDGNWTRVYPDGGGNYPVGAVPFVPTIHEAVDMHNYSATLDGESLRSEIIIGTNQPDPKNPASTGFIRYYPKTANEAIRPGVPALRNIVRPAMWVNSVFTNPEEQRIMAELINLQIWFSQRTGNITCTANPNIGINDQIRVVERNTSETYIHYVRGAATNMDLDNGTYTMTLTTNWLGDSDNWVITAENIYNPITQIQISEPLDRWLSLTQRELPTGGTSIGAVRTIDFTGDFNAATAPVYQDATPYYTNAGWQLNGTLSAVSGVTSPTIKTEMYSTALGVGTLEILTTDATPTVVETVTLGLPGETVSLSNIAAGNYTIRITGYPISTGNADLRITLSGTNIEPAAIQDNIILVNVPYSMGISGITGFFEDGLIGTPDVRGRDTVNPASIVTGEVMGAAPTITKIYNAYPNALDEAPDTFATAYYGLDRVAALVNVNDFGGLPKPANPQAFGNNYLTFKNLGIENSTTKQVVSSYSSTLNSSSLDIRIRLRKSDLTTDTVERYIFGRSGGGETFWYLQKTAGGMRWWYNTSGTPTSLGDFPWSTWGFKDGEWRWVRMVTTPGPTNGGMYFYASADGGSWTFIAGTALTGSVALKTTSTGNIPITIGSNPAMSSTTLAPWDGDVSHVMVNSASSNGSTWWAGEPIIGLDADHMAGTTWTDGRNFSWTAGDASLQVIDSASSPSFGVPTVKATPQITSDNATMGDRYLSYSTTNDATNKTTGGTPALLNQGYGAMTVTMKIRVGVGALSGGWSSANTNWIVGRQDTPATATDNNYAWKIYADSTTATQYLKFDYRYTTPTAAPSTASHSVALSNIPFKDREWMWLKVAFFGSTTTSGSIIQYSTDGKVWSNPTGGTVSVAAARALIQTTTQPLSIGAGKHTAASPDATDLGMGGDIAYLEIAGSPYGKGSLAKPLFVLDAQNASSGGWTTYLGDALTTDASTVVTKDSTPNSFGKPTYTQV